MATASCSYFGYSDSLLYYNALNTFPRPLPECLLKNTKVRSDAEILACLEEDDPFNVESWVNWLSQGGRGGEKLTAKTEIIDLSFDLALCILRGYERQVLHINVCFFLSKSVSYAKFLILFSLASVCSSRLSRLTSSLFSHR